MTVIDGNYCFTSVSFTNGKLLNGIIQNSLPCKLISFAKLQGLNKADTLVCFGDYYRVDVLENPHGEDHQNIRNLMKTGWKAISFENEALTKKL